MSYTPTLDTFLEKEEVITPEEYLTRREKGSIKPENVTIIPADMETGSFGGFKVKLDVPRYRVSFNSFGEGYNFDRI